jgi:hypothetical protein
MLVLQGSDKVETVVPGEPHKLIYHCKELR